MACVVRMTTMGRAELQEADTRMSGGQSVLSTPTGQPEFRTGMQRGFSCRDCREWGRHACHVWQIPLAYIPHLDVSLMAECGQRTPYTVCPMVTQSRNRDRRDLAGFYGALASPMLMLMGQGEKHKLPWSGAAIPITRLKNTSDKNIMEKGTVYDYQTCLTKS